MLERQAKDLAKRLRIIADTIEHHANIDALHEEILQEEQNIFQLPLLYQKKENS